jgi:hypothetical protein
MACWLATTVAWCSNWQRITATSAIGINKSWQGEHSAQNKDGSKSIHFNVPSYVSLQLIGKRIGKEWRLTQRLKICLEIATKPT